MIKNTLVFNQIRGPNYEKGCDAFKNVLEYDGQFCCIPTGNACLSKCLEFF